MTTTFSPEFCQACGEITGYCRCRVAEPSTVVEDSWEPPPQPVDNGQSAVDRRYLELRGRLLDVAGLRDIPPPTPLVEDYLYRDSLAWLGGKPGHGKSFLAVDLACCIGTGTAWHGHRVRRGRALYLIAEGAAGLSRRVDAWSLAHGRTVENVLFLPVPVQLLTHLDVAAFAQLLTELDPDLVILDTQARVTVGGEENSSKDMGRFVDALEQIRQRCGACILVVHHEARAGENLRGSTALEGAATTILRACKDGDQITITNTKQKDAPEQPPLMLALAAVGVSAVLSHEAVGIAGFTTESELAVLAVLRDSFGPAGATKTELRDACDQPRTSYYRSLNALVGKGLVHEHKDGRSTRYVLPTEDRQGTLDEDSHESHAVPSVPRDSWDSSTWNDGTPTQSHRVPTTPNGSDLQHSHSPTESHQPGQTVPQSHTPIGGGTTWEPHHNTGNEDLPCDHCGTPPSRVGSDGSRWCRTCAPTLWPPSTEDRVAPMKQGIVDRLVNSKFDVAIDDAQRLVDDLFRRARKPIIDPNGAYDRIVRRLQREKAAP